MVEKNDDEKPDRAEKSNRAELVKNVSEIVAVRMLDEELNSSTDTTCTLLIDDLGKRKVCTHLS